jgi:hypothetical protein
LFHAGNTSQEFVDDEDSREPSRPLGAALRVTHLSFQQHNVLLLDSIGYPVRYFLQVSVFDSKRQGAQRYNGEKCRILSLFYASLFYLELG